MSGIFTFSFNGDDIEEHPSKASSSDGFSQMLPVSQPSVLLQQTEARTLDLNDAVGQELRRQRNWMSSSTDPPWS